MHARPTPDRSRFDTRRVGCRLLIVSFAAGALALGLVACSDDGDAADTPATSVGTSPAGQNASSTTSAGTTTTLPIPSLDLTGEGVCARLSGPDVTTTIGFDVTAAPSTSATPQCAYTFTAADGVTSNLTVALMRPEGDLGGRTGQEGYQYVVDLNRTIAQGDDIEESAPPAGDQAILISGSSLQLGVILIGNSVLTVIAPADGVGASQVDALMVLVGQRFAA